MIGGRAALALLACAAVAAGGCGEEAPQRTPPAVVLRVTAPADGATVRSDRVQVRGTVRPSGAKVRVMGQEAGVEVGGSWRAEVELEPGANVLDVSAAARGRRPALVALRVQREVPVRVPDLSGRDPDDAIAELEALGLKGEARDAGGLIDDLLPGDPQVCASDPEPGTEVRPGTTVTLETQKVC